MTEKAIGYGQYCPIAHALEVLGERWSLLIVRDLLTGNHRFNDIARSEPGLSRTLLAKRLRQLEAAGIVRRVGAEYRLTDAGEELRGIVFALGEWGAKWAFGAPEPAELDAELLMWWMHTRIDTGLLDSPRTVLQFEFRDDPRPFWLVVESGEPSVCFTDPGFEVDVVVRSDLRSLYEVWLGRVPLRSALRNDLISFEGPGHLTRRMVDVLQLSPVAEMVASATERSAMTAGVRVDHERH
jgi:DNA-binding HxlR family transcriptional regulator